MREKHLQKRIMEATNGITPAYAGKTFGVIAFLPDSWDHPRVCGKN